MGADLRELLEEELDLLVHFGGAGRRGVGDFKMTSDEEEVEQVLEGEGSV